ncbi:hypothetical protein [Rickettsiella endosymbiont of Rhagonycha lignosa]|uniref:hypothetical protein n=1 Tax=Rickettsiella endosymbiont of Rhagonycha lignosa TaxID=3077937 RepID=UPI00313B9CCC
MLNNKINFLISHFKTKAATSPDLHVKSETFALGPRTPNNTPNSSYERIGSTVKFYISSSSSSESDSYEATYSTTQRRYTF